MGRGRMGTRPILPPGLIKMASPRQEHGEELLMDLEGFLSNPLGVHSRESPTPPTCVKEECFMGIDEAGRGPVLGEHSLSLSVYIYI